MKKILFIIIVASLATILIACGKKADKTDISDETTIVVDTKEDEVAEDEIVEDEITEDEVTKDEIAEDEITDEAIAGAQNNGGHFVGMSNDMIYYVSPGDEAMYESRLFGEYIDRWCGPAFLMAYNCKTDGVETIADGDFYGSLWVLKDSIFVEYFEAEEGDSRSGVSIVEPENRTVDHAKGEALLGGDTTGNYVVTRGQYSQDYTALYVYTDVDSMVEIDVEDYTDFIGIEDGYLVVVCGDDDKKIVCYDVSEPSREIELGAVPKREYETVMDYPEFEQFLAADGKLYLSICWYEGTGHFFAEQTVVTADFTVAGSLEKIDILSADDYSVEEGAATFTVINGEAIRTEGIPQKGFCTYSEGEYGYYDEKGKAIICGNGFAVEYSEDGDISFMNECAEYVNGRICLVNNNLVRNPEDDIGWRYAYIRRGTSIFVEEVNGPDGRNIENITNQDYLDE